MSTVRIAIVVLGLTFLTGCASKIIRLEGSFAELRTRAPRFGLGELNVQQIEYALKRRGDVRITTIEQLPEHRLRVRSERLSDHASFENLFYYCRGDLVLGEIDKDDVVSYSTDWLKP